MKTIKLEYGNVEIGKTLVKTIEILNESCNEQIYQVQRDPTTNPLDHVFYLRSYTWTLAPDEKFLCEIRYRPLASSKNVDYFVITDTSGATMKIIVYGSGIGPEVNCSTTKIFMNCTCENPEVKKRIKLTNNSKVTATFMFNIDKKHKFLQLDTTYGIIHPCSYKYITITFQSPKTERYTYHLAILILHQEPIIIELHGYCGSTPYKKEDINYIAYPWKEKNGFKGYMKDIVNTLGDLPPVSLSKHYFNFGQADVDVENVIQRIPQAICLTNHSYSNLLIIWEEDTDGIFNVSPQEMEIRLNQSALFELTFNPDVKNNLFGREIIGSVFLEQKNLSTFPFVTSVTVIGHSFPSTSGTWIPQYEMPQTVIMPPCVPAFPVYTTFLIKKFGHLPLMFQFVAPQITHFIVKPMLGVIYEEYQIIVIEMTSEPKDEQIYIERWTVYFNGNMKTESYINFKGYAEYANVIFNNNNLLSFSSILPGCEQFAQLGMRNVTRHRLKYQFYQLPPELNMECISGEIDANDTLYQECSFSPTESNVDYDFEVQCVLVVIKDGVTIGSKCCINLRVRARSEMGLLTAIPNELNFDEVEYNDTKTLSFDLINSSSVNIYYKLIYTHRNYPLGNLEEDVKVHPLSETVFSTSHKRITISITPRTATYYEFAIQYLIRVNYRSDVLVAKQSPIRICNVCCMCILPTIKVQNVCTFGYRLQYSLNVSKPFLWRTLRINRLNKTLEEMLPGETSTININLFPMIVNDGEIFIKWSVINPSTLPVSLVLKRIKQCSCEPVVKKIGISLQRVEIDCPHKDLCIINLKSTTLQPGEETILGMNIRFTLVGKSTICWNLDIGHNRCIILNMIIDCLTKSETQNNFLSSPLVLFRRVYIANKEPVYRIHWIHNIMDNDLPYSLNIDNLRKLNESYHCEVFSCLNPNGIVNAQTDMPLIIKYQPRMFGKHEVTVPVTMGNETTELTLKGEASSDFRTISIGRQIPDHCSCRIALFPAYFSVDCIDMWSVPTHSTIVKMVLVYNNLDNDALAYEWQCLDIPGLLHVDIFPRKGIMNPNAVQSFRVRIYTKGCPCRIDVHIPCVFFNASKRREYQRSIIKHTILSQELEGQFTITEKGTSVPKPWIKILDEPERCHKTLSLRCSICSVEDKHIKVSLLKELEAAPVKAIAFNNSKTCNITKEKDLPIVTFILEGLLWNIVSDRKFKKIVEDSLIPRRNLYYSQFKMDLSERKKLTQRSYISQPLTLINSILEEMLFIIVHEEFSLTSIHLIPNEDIRHSNYLKLSPKEKRFNYEDDLTEGPETVDETDTEYDSSKNKFRVSFVV
ncbi:Cilia- and flagella-associated protein 65 [Anthophora quadrimaculata]